MCHVKQNVLISTHTNFFYDWCRLPNFTYAQFPCTNGGTHCLGSISHAKDSFVVRADTLAHMHNYLCIVFQPPETLWNLSRVIRSFFDPNFEDVSCRKMALSCIGKEEYKCAAPRGHKGGASNFGNINRPASR